MEKTDTPISHVTDTAFWVATYRAEETLRPDALFKDPLAAKLAGKLGDRISSEMWGSRYVRWNVVTRTVVIDRYIEELLAQGVETILNLGAGLDTRPYRMNLPAQLRWIEVDYESTIRLKEDRLAGELPKCRLERIALDLSDRDARTKLFSRIASESGKVVVLTEGVIPYLTEDDVRSLGEDLRAQESIRFWIAEYMSPQMYPYFKKKKRERQMRLAPFRFMPVDWFGFFERAGWKPLETRYLAEVSEKLGRPVPVPWWAAVLRIFPGARKSARMRSFSGYVLFARK